MFLGERRFTSANGLFFLEEKSCSYMVRSIVLFFNGLKPLFSKINRLLFIAFNFHCQTFLNEFFQRRRLPRLKIRADESLLTAVKTLP